MEIVSIKDTGLKKKENQILAKIGALISKEMQERCPNETGLMKASIFEEVSGNQVTIGTHGIPYASYVEYFDWTGLPSADFTKVAKPTPEMPNEMWLALFKRGQIGQTIPFARSTAFYSDKKILQEFKEVFR